MCPQAVCNSLSQGWFLFTFDILILCLYCYASSADALIKAYYREKPDTCLASGVESGGVGGRNSHKPLMYRLTVQYVISFTLLYMLNGVCTGSTYISVLRGLFFFLSFSMEMPKSVSVWNLFGICLEMRKLACSYHKDYKI